MLTQANIISRLDYCNTPLCDTALKETWRFEFSGSFKISKVTAEHFLKGAGQFENTMPVPEHLSRFGFELKRLILTFKVLQGLGPTYIKVSPSVYEPMQQVHSSQQFSLAVYLPRSVRSTSWFPRHLCSSLWVLEELPKRCQETAFISYL